MKTKVFIYRGVIGIESDPEAEGIIAKPGNGNLGCVTDASKAEISTEALEALKAIPRGHDGLGEIDVFKASDDMVVFAWLGGYLKAFKAADCETSRDYNPSLLTATEGVETPQEFKDFVDELLAEEAGEATDEGDDTEYPMGAVEAPETEG